MISASIANREWSVTDRARTLPSPRESYNPEAENFKRDRGSYQSEMEHPVRELACSEACGSRPAADAHVCKRPFSERTGRQGEPQSLYSTTTMSLIHELASRALQSHSRRPMCAARPRHVSVSITLGADESAGFVSHMSRSGVQHGGWLCRMPDAARILLCPP